jgi:hypothetical protein
LFPEDYEVTKGSNGNSYVDIMKFYEDLYIPIFVRYNNKKNRYEWYIASNEQKDLMNSNIIPKPEPDVININLYEPRINKLKKKPLILRLTQNDNNINYYDGMVADLVTLHEQFTQDKWTPVCLPFEVSKSILNVNGWRSRVHEFRYIENGQLYVATTDNMEAGKAYIMNANARLAAKDEHYLGRSLIDTSADKVMNLRCASDYDGLDGYKSSGDFELVGTLRRGIFTGESNKYTYFRINNNNELEELYPNMEYEIPAYSGLFRKEKGIQSIK